MCRFNSGVSFLVLRTNRLTYSTLVFLQARAVSEIQVLLAGGVGFVLYLLPFPTYKHARPDVTFFCDLDFDPFLFMQDHEKVYGARILNTFSSGSDLAQVSPLAFLSMERRLKRSGRLSEVLSLCPFARSQVSLIIFTSIRVYGSEP